MGQLLGFSDEHSTLVAMVRNFTTNFFSHKLHVLFDEQFSTIHNNTSLEETEVEAIFNDILTNCRDFYGEEVSSSEDTISAPEGADVDPPPDLGGEWLTEAG